MEYKLIFNEHGQMEPSYFQGTKGVQLNLYIHNEMTKREVLEALKEEMNIHYDHIGYTLFEANNKLIPLNLDENLTKFLDNIKKQNQDTLDNIFDINIETPEEFNNPELDIAPFIFSITIEFLE